MEATKIDEALQRATKEFGLCPNRVWAIGHNLKHWEKKLPELIPTSERQKGMGIIGHEGHERCTFELCEYSLLNYTSVTQRHEYGVASCREEKRCSTIKGLFSVSKLDEASLAGRPTAWRLGGKSTIDVAEPYMAISHVWSDGTGNGVSANGEVNECLYRFFERIARRWQCTGIWWDAICIPKDKAAKERAIKRMEHNYEGARITLVHDCYIRSWKWVDAETACLAIILSPWFSRGWTALELARSTRVKVIFKDMVIKDLDEDILSQSNSDSACHRFATEAIRGLRNKRVDNLNDLLTVLGPRSTSWPRDMARISALLVGTPKASGEEKQHVIYQQVLREIGWVAHGHLFHRSATMTGPFSWCATNLLAMPMAPQTREKLHIDYDGAIGGRWKVIDQKSVPRERYVLHNGFPLVDMKVNVTLEAADRSVLLGEPDAKLLSRAIAAKVLDPAKHSYEFMGPVYFNPPLALNEVHWETVNRVRISGSQEKTYSGQRIMLDAPSPTVPIHLSYIVPYKTISTNTYSSKEERLLLAVLEGDSDKAEDVLREGYVDVTFKDSAGWTALHYAVRRGYHSLIYYLLRQTSADVAVQDDLGQQCIHLAAERGDCDLLSIHEVFMTEHKVCKDGQTALHRAVLAGSLEMVTMLLEKLGDDDLKDVQDSQGRTALHLCAELGLGNIFTELLSRQANPLLKDNTGRTTLHYAVMDWNDTTDIDIISTLLGYEELNVPDNDGRTPLHYAADIGYPRYVKLLSRKTNLVLADSRGETALHAAVNGGHLEAVKELLKRDTELHELPQITMDAVLHLAASLNHKEIVQALVNHGASILHRDSIDNKTAVEVAVEQKSAPLTMFLMEFVLSSPQSEDCPPGWIKVARTCPLDDDSPSALHHAVRKNHQRVAVALIADGEDIFQTDAIGTTVISVAVGKMAKVVVQGLVDQYVQAIWRAKQLEVGIKEMAASRSMALDSYCLTELGQPFKDMLVLSWTAVSHLENAFMSTRDREMQKLLSPDWEAIRSQSPMVESTRPMVIGDNLTPSRLHGVNIDGSDSRVEKWSSEYRQLVLQDRLKYLIDDGDEEEEEEEDSSSESDESNSQRRRGRWHNDDDESEDEN